MKNLPKYRAHKSGQARVTLAGKDHYLGTYGSPESKQKYAQLIAEYSASSSPASFGVDPKSVTLATIMAEYIRHADNHYPRGVNSESAQIRLILRVVKNLYADLAAASFGPQQFKAVRQVLIDNPACQRSARSRKKKAEPLSRQYINAQMSRLVRMFRWAAADGIIPSETYLNLKVIPGLQIGRSRAPEAKAIEPVSDYVVEQTLPHCSPVVADMVRVQRLTGMRPGEVCKLTPGMLDRRGDVWIATLKEHKGAWRGKSRHVYFGPKTQLILMPYLEREADACCFSPTESEQRRIAARAPRRTPLNQGNRPVYSSRVRARKTVKKKPRDHYDTASYQSRTRTY